ncbi:MAG TPA: hypothetical protein VII18_23400 [Mycobacterium sp.]
MRRNRRGEKATSWIIREKRDGRDGPILVKPHSRGRIALRSAVPTAKPIIDPRYLSDSDGIDDGGDLVLWPLLLERAQAEATEDRGDHGRTTSGHRGRTTKRSIGSATGADSAAIQKDSQRCSMISYCARREGGLPLAEKYVTAAEWQQMGQHGIDTFQKHLLPLTFGMLMYEGDPAVMRRTLSNVPQPARLLMPIIAPRAFSRHARRVYGTATPPEITA